MYSFVLWFCVISPSTGCCWISCWWETDCCTSKGWSNQLWKVYLLPSNYTQFASLLSLLIWNISIFCKGDYCFFHCNHKKLGSKDFLIFNIICTGDFPWNMVITSTIFHGLIYFVTEHVYYQLKLLGKVMKCLGLNTNHWNCMETYCVHLLVQSKHLHD